MQQRSKLVVSVTLLVMLSLLFSGMPQQEAEARQQAVNLFRVGYIGSPDEDFARGVELAISQINESGGTEANDGRLYDYEIVFAPAETAADVPDALGDLVFERVIGIFGPSSNEYALANIEALSAAPAPVITATTSDSLFIGDEGTNIFRALAPDSVYGQAIADYLVEVAGAQDIALIYSGTQNEAKANAFIAALNSGHTLSPELIIENEAVLSNRAAELVSLNPDAIVMFTDRVGNGFQLIEELRGRNWQGELVYNNAQSELIGPDYNGESVEGVIGVDGWTFGDQGSLSPTFVAQYVARFGDVPSAKSVAGYDAFFGFDRAVRNNPTDGDSLRTGLNALAIGTLVRGPVSTSAYPERNMSMTAYVYGLTGRGGTTTLAIYDNGILREGSVSAIIDNSGGEDTIVPTATLLSTPTPTTAATATPSVVTVTVAVERLNVRTGPDLSYERFTQVDEGEQFPVSGHNGNFTWYLIQVDGRLGWVASEFVTIFDPGSLVAGLPVIPAPPTPTNIPTEVPQVADLVATSVEYIPAQPEPSCTFTARVTIANQGPVDSGPFAVATTFIPNNNSTYTASNVSGIPANGSTQVDLVTVINQSANVPNLAYVVDLNNAVQEGPGENNNIYTATFRIDKPLIAQNTTAVSVGNSFDLAGGTPDFSWDGTNMTMLNGAMVGTISNQGFQDYHYDQIPSAANAGVFNNLQQNNVLAIVTAEGARAVLRADTIAGDQTLGFTFRVYNDKSSCQP